MLERVLARVVRTGSLEFAGASGRRQTFGDGTGPTVTLHIRSRVVEAAMLVRPTLALGEGYMDGSVQVEGGSIYDVLALLARNADNVPQTSLLALWPRLTNWLKQRNPVERARRNVAHHYDLSPTLYDLFLDEDRQYSCAYFSSPQHGLDEAQRAKKRHVAAKLLLDRPGLRVLDVGSGWGGLGLFLAREFEADVTGVTLSVEQYNWSLARSEAAGLHGRAQFALRDYRQQSGQFDRIVSVGMFEHVGKRNYGEFFAKLADLLAEDGVALLHTCGFLDHPAPIDPFVRKYIFPGADQPSLSEISAAVQASGLLITDVEVLRLHYAETLRFWRMRFLARRAEAAQLYDERFCRMWEYYLALCEVGFRYRTSVVFQIQLTHRLDAVPITRDYMVDAERQLQERSVVEVASQS